MSQYKLKMDLNQEEWACFDDNLGLNTRKWTLTGQNW